LLLLHAELSLEFSRSDFERCIKMVDTKKWQLESIRTFRGQMKILFSYIYFSSHVAHLYKI